MDLDIFYCILWILSCKCCTITNKLKVLCVRMVVHWAETVIEFSTLNTLALRRLVGKSTNSSDLLANSTVPEAFDPLVKATDIDLNVFIFLQEAFEQGKISAFAFYMILVCIGFVLLEPIYGICCWRKQYNSNDKYEKTFVVAKFIIIGFDFSILLSTIAWAIVADINLFDFEANPESVIFKIAAIDCALNILTTSVVFCKCYKRKYDYLKETITKKIGKQTETVRGKIDNAAMEEGVDNMTMKEVDDNAMAKERGVVN